MQRPGLIRWNFIGFLILAIVLCLAYVFFALNGHIRNLLEQRLSSLNGAKVEIGNTALNFSIPSITLENVVFNDPYQEGVKHLELGKVVLQLEWQPLLRNRFVIKEGVISDVHLPSIQGGAPVNTDTGKSLLASAQSHSLAIASDFLSNPVRKQLPTADVWNAVPSVQAKKGLNSELETLVGNWKKQLNGIVEDHSQQRLAFEGKQINESQVKVALAQLERNRSELEHFSRQVKVDGNALLIKIESLGELLPHDITVIRQGIKLPSMEFTQIAGELGAKQAKTVIGLLDKFYYRLLPWLLEKEDPLNAAKGRLHGTDFFFTGRTLPPRLWIQKLDLFSKESPDGRIGTALGRIDNLSSEPSLYPAQLSLQASFGKAEISGVHLDAQIDHRQGKIDDRLRLAVAAYPVRDLDFVKTPSFRMGIVQATANLDLEFLIQDNRGLINIRSTLDRVNYRVEAEDEQVKQIFDSALSPLTTLQMEANAQGKMPSLHWNYTSNLSDRLRSDLQQVLSQEYAEYHARIKEEAERNMLEAKKALETRLMSETESIQQGMGAELERLKGTTQDLSNRK